MDNIKTYTFKGKRGITDLSNDIGGDFVTQWWTEEDWAKWRAGEADRIAADRKYVQDLKEKGEYGEEFEMKLSFVPHPLFDEPKINDSPSMTRSVFFLNMNIDDLPK